MADCETSISVVIPFDSANVAIANCSVSPASGGQVDPGDSIQATFDIQNNNDASGDVTVEVTANGSVVGSVTENVGANSTVTASVTFTTGDAGASGGDTINVEIDITNAVKATTVAAPRVGGQGTLARSAHTDSTKRRIAGLTRNCPILREI